MWFCLRVVGWGRQCLTVAAPPHTRPIPNPPLANTRRPPTMTKDPARQRELQPMALCEPCQGIQRNWRKAPGHAELVQRGNRKEDRDHGPVTFTRYVCDRCGTAWEYENDKTNQQAGWSVVGR